MNCTICETPLTGGLDTYGDTGEELCFDCWNMLESADFSSWYGMAPHYHDTEAVGGFIGSTRLLPLPEPDQNGVYRVGDLYFVPDAETDGASGMWYDGYPGEAQS